MAANPKLDKRLRKILLKHEVIDEDSLTQAEAIAADKDMSLSRVLVEEKIVNEPDLLSAMAVETALPPIDLEKITVDEEILDGFGEDLAKYYGVVPVARIQNILTVAVSDPFDLLKLDDVRIVTNSEIRPVISTEPTILESIDRIYNQRQAEMQNIIAQSGEMEMELVEKEEDEEIGDDLSAIETGDGTSPVVKLVNLLIVEAIKRRASDIHIEPLEKKVRIRFRIDGILQEAHTLAKKVLAGMVSRVKIMASLDIAEKGRPQDGMFQLKVDGRKVDFRVSIIPITAGEKVVLRILDGSALVLSLEALGFEPKSLDDFRWSINQPYGMILATGPSGSGKTTTLYSGLVEILTPDDNVITVEDPVEYQMEGVNQCQTNAKAGMTFAAALRSILRQDPDKIMIGEIRDVETIEIALRAALTGHLVLSSLHTNDATQAVTRISNMGVDNFLIASTGLLITSQRLARTLCKNCRQIQDKNKEEMLELQFTPEEIEQAKLYKANPDGCSSCHKGYRGRLAVIESLRFTDGLRRAIVDDKNAIELKKIAVKEGMVTLRRSGILKVVRGLTSIEEMKRVTMAD